MTNSRTKVRATRDAEGERIEPMAPRPCRKLVIVLGDQLSPNISSLRNADRQHDIVLMVEVEREATYVKHHKKKIAFIFSAMRHFADELRSLGWRVEYRGIESTGSQGSFSGELERAIGEHNPTSVAVTSAGEWRVQQEIDAWSRRFSVPVEIFADDRFLCSQHEFADWAADRKSLRMEYFYREMRRKTGLLMDGDQPTGGQWNYDKENRKTAKPDLFMPRPPRFAPDAVTQKVLGLVDDRFPDHFGDLTPFWFAVARPDAERALSHFVSEALPRFGDYQDAMLVDEPFLYHSVLSVYLNAGLLDPLDICRKVELAYRQGLVPLNAAEGFIRQIVGWREYVRGIYWLKMPEYVQLNFFAHERPVPWFYWTAETKMSCLKHAIGQTKTEAYAHHIQRLMLTGNFALLAGVSPQELHEWYLIVYADAYEWVELPNTLGMSQFADGGLLASKPYVASGAYINRMSDYCKRCHYDVKDASGPKACPFNALYWSFLDRNRETLEGNPRLAQMYNTLRRMDGSKRAAILSKAQSIVADVDTL